MENWVSKFEINAERMLEAYNREHCGFFDASLPFGGPDPNPELRPNGAPRRPTDRKRRSDEEADGFTDEFGELLRYCGPARRVEDLTRRRICFAR